MRDKDRHLWDDDDPTTWIMEEYTYIVTKYASLVSPEDVIQKFIDLINETCVFIKDAEFFLKFPIITTGIAKVYLDNCVAHLDGEGAGFVNISGLQSGSVITNNIIKPEPYHTYGSQNRMDYFPSKTEYHLTVNKNDKVVKSHTDKRGYPASCGVENKEKDIVIIIRGDQ